MPEDPKDQREKFTDELLDAALRNYGRTEPRAGLEYRVLRAVEEKQQQSSGWFGQWRWAAAAVCTIVIAGGAALLNVNRGNVGDAVHPAAVEQRAAPANATPSAVAPSQSRPGVSAPVMMDHPAALTVAPVNRAPRFNRVRPNEIRLGAGAPVMAQQQPQQLPDCKQAEEAADANIAASAPAARAEEKDEALAKRDVATSKAAAAPQANAPARADCAPVSKKAKPAAPPDRE